MAEKSARKKIWHFAESPIAWGALGLLGGAIIVLIPAVRLKYFFIAAWILIVIAQLRERFWEGRGWLRFIGNTVLAGVLGTIFALGWHYIPKPKEPPTISEIAEAVVARLGNQNDSGGTNPRAAAIADQVAKRMVQVRSAAHIQADAKGLIRECSDKYKNGWNHVMWWAQFPNTEKAQQLEWDKFLDDYKQHCKDRMLMTYRVLQGRVNNIPQARPSIDAEEAFNPSVLEFTKIEDQLTIVSVYLNEFEQENRLPITKWNPRWR